VRLAALNLGGDLGVGSGGSVLDLGILGFCVFFTEIHEFSLST